MLNTIRNAWKIPELRKKLLFTIFVLLIFRLGNAVPVPFIDANLLGDYFDQLGNTVLGLYNVMSGDAFSRCTIFALSIQPYINASIIINLLTVAIPALERLQKEGGEEGRKKIASITRYSTIAIALLQGFGYYMLMKNGYSQPIITTEGIWPAIVIIMTFVAGASLLMWLGEQITEKGVGNGISLIIFAGIVSRLPSMAQSLYAYAKGGGIGLIGVVALLIMIVVVVGLVVMMNEAERRIPVQYAKRVVGRKMYGGQSTHIPIKVASAGVIPIIFAMSIMSFPSTIAGFFGVTSQTGGFWGGFLKIFSSTSWVYAILYFLLIIFFTYFYTAIQFNPIEMSNNMKKNGGFIPGIRPGRPTSEYISKTLSRITLVGAIFLGLIAILPIFINLGLGINNFAIGGTSLLIVVGVALETVKDMESQMLMRHYKGFLE